MIRRFFSKGYKTYKQAIDDAFNRRNLFWTNILLSVGISTVGDILEQTYQCFNRHIGEYDFVRTTHMAICGFTNGCVCHHWYNFLDKFIVGKTVHMSIRKLLLDQFIFSPVLIVSFFATVAIFEEHPIDTFNAEIKHKFWALYRAEWLVWPPAQIINFYFVPTKYRVLFDNTISIGYDIYTSHVKHSKYYIEKSSKIN